MVLARERVFSDVETVGAAGVKGSMGGGGGQIRWISCRDRTLLLIETTALGHASLHWRGTRMRRGEESRGGDEFSLTGNTHVL
jgi:hypothetical protein